MTKTIFSLGLFQLLLLFSLPAQQLTLSPYSRYAIGEIFHNASARHAAMGGLGIAVDNYFSVNRVNPASFADIVFTTMDFSAFGQYSRFRSNESSEDQVTAGFQHLAFGFPSNNGIVFTMGFAPYSSVGYATTAYQSVQLEDTSYIQETRFTGEGGTNQAFIGVAGKLFKKKLRLGASGQFIFGGINQNWQNTIYQLDSANIAPQFQPVRVTEDRYLRGFSVQGGLVYQDTLSVEKNVLFRLGAMIDYNFNLQEDISTYYTNLIIEDTLDSRSISLRSIQLPLKYGAGLSVHRPGYWTFGLDVTMQDWEPFEAYANGADLGREMRVAVGGEVIPKFDSPRYLRRISYRLGGYYKQSYFNGFGSSPINDLGLTFGLGLPSSRKGNSRLNQGRSTSKVNFSFALGKRGNLLADHPVEELYARFTLGISLNDRWFVRRVVD
jgi:hypothetical protein